MSLTRCSDPRIRPWLRAPTLLVALAAALALGAARAPAEEVAEPDRRPHTDEQHAAARERFDREYASADLGERIQALARYGKWRHKEVLKVLTRTFQREADLELKAAAAEGLGHQTPFARDAGRTLIQALDGWKSWASRDEPMKDDERIRNEDEARVLTRAIESVGKLGYKDGWKTLKPYIDHPHDFVAGATMTACGRLKEYRALAPILEWFNFYPDGYSWAGGSVRVDTGAPGNVDANAARSLWRARYGNRAKKARPNTMETMIEALKMITGVEFEKPEQLRAWMDENKLFLKRHGA
jgi:hypothetical protein